MRISVFALVVGIAFAGAARAQGGFPVANAGPDVTVECVGQNGTPIAMNGSGSTVDDNADYLWTAPGVTFDDPTLLNPIGTFPVGSTVATLTVTFTDPATGSQFSNADTVTVTVGDTTPPTIYGQADPSVLWPPNHSLHEVNVDLLVYDRCDAAPEVELVSITSNESDDGNGDGNTTGDIQGAQLGTDDRTFLLRAERSGPGDGRVYTAVYRVWDLADNASVATVEVIVPHDMGNGGAGSGGDDDGWDDGEDEIKRDKKHAKKAEKAQLKAAKKAAKAGKKAYKAALKASR